VVRASRFPSPDELFMNGSAPTSPVYGIGDPDLGVETSRGASPTIGVAAGPVRAEVSGWATWIDDYVYFAPARGPDGGPRVAVTVRGAFPEWAFRPIDALFYGLDGDVEIGADSVVAVAAGGAIVRGLDRSDGQGLVLVPPDRARVAVRLQPRIRRIEQPFLEANGQWVAAQTRVDPADDLAPAPPAYALLGAGLGARFAVGARTASFGLEAWNLLDVAYRDYTSLLRYSADEPGREVRLRLGFEF
jgi:iron complex outermembrane receptor protein